MTPKMEVGGLPCVIGKISVQLACYVHVEELDVSSCGHGSLAQHSSQIHCADTLFKLMTVRFTKWEAL